jgi:hypothetical protein
VVASASTEGNAKRFGCLAILMTRFAEWLLKSVAGACRVPLSIAS